MDDREILPGDGSVRLLPGFLDPDRADEAQEVLTREIPWEAGRILMFGREVAEPRLSAWIADQGVVYGYSGRNRAVHPWTPLLDDIRSRLADVTGQRFNGVLANLYRDGGDHMGWHADDEASLGPDPVIASVSLGAERRFDLRHRETRETVSVVLPHGSLLVMSGASQRCWKHRIAKSSKTTSARVNLTFRRILTTG